MAWVALVAGFTFFPVAGHLPIGSLPSTGGLDWLGIRALGLVYPAPNSLREADIVWVQAKQEVEEEEEEVELESWTPLNSEDSC